MLLRICMAFALLLSSTTVQAAWMVAETLHFRIHGTVTESRIREEAAVLEDFHALLEFLTDRKFPPDAPKLDIYMVESRRQMLVVRPGLPTRAAGFYAATPGGILAMSLEPTASQMEFARDTLLHEYAHHFMMQAGNSALPAWYVEGFAEYLMTADFRPDRIDFGGVNRSRFYVLSELAWVPLEQVLKRPPGVNVHSFYAQSWLLTHYLNRVEGMPAKRDAYLRKVAAGADPVEAFRQEIDPDLKAFQARLRNYFEGRSLTFSRMKRKPPGAFDIRVSRLPSAADAMLIPLVAVQLPQEPEDDAANMARLREGAAKAPDDPWVKRALAIAEAAAGDEAEAAARLDALLLETPADPELLRWRAHLYKPWRESAPPEDVSAARRLLVRANRAAPNDWLVLSDYVSTYEASGEKLPDSVLEVLAKARSLAPQVAPLAWRTAIAMARAGDYAIAEAALAPLVNNPHVGRDMTREQALLDALRAGEKQGVEAALAELKAARAAAAD